MTSAGYTDRASQAYGRLRELIVRGQLAPGARIIETDIADRLGVSRTPVRSALHRLQQEGYVVASGNGRQARLAVAPLTQEDARELFGIVGEIEALAARWIAERDEEDRRALVSDLEAINNELLAASRSERPDRNRVFELDGAFHRCYVEAGAGPRLLSLHDAIKPQTDRYVRLYVSALMDEIGTSVTEHAEIIEEIRAGEPDRTQRAVQTNWRNAAERLCRVIASMGERGSW